ncbi:MAG: YjbQ family protein [Tenericutes bacterium]|nr:YjbQ family protein [Mycoplasmatota bacterium]MBI9009665.1 YjbQ family protein [Mycoplasmatota bacterium]
MWIQKEILIKPRNRGFHIITREIENQIGELKNISVGTAHIFIKHTSASLTLNENADPDVRVDMESHINKLAPENASHYTHIFEGSDDMPAHIKASLLGNSVTVPITNGGFNLGTWQGVYLGEHRNNGGSRRIVVTINGE